MSDLESFFAKKNKKKVKGKKFANPDDIAKRLEEKEKKLEKDLHKVEPKKLLDDGLASVKNSLAVQATKKEEEEEWQDYKDAGEHDLTDLKLSKLQIENDEEYGGYGSGDEGDQCSKGDQSDGVWGKAAPVEAPPTPAPVVIETKTPVVSQPSSYLPPHMRHGSSAAPRVSSKKSKQAPDITNEMAFPSLGDVPAPPPTTPWSAGSRSRSDDVRYESSMKYGSTRTVEQQAPRINTSNRFNALSDRS